jgi:surface protein
MNFMFYGSPTFNQPIGNWDVSKVTGMKRMLSECPNFNQDLSRWNVDNVLECDSFSSLSPSWVLPKPNFTNCNPD